MDFVGFHRFPKCVKERIPRVPRKARRGFGGAEKTTSRGRRCPQRGAAGRPSEFVGIPKEFERIPRVPRKARPGAAGAHPPVPPGGEEFVRISYPPGAPGGQGIRSNSLGIPKEGTPRRRRGVHSLGIPLESLRDSMPRSPGHGPGSDSRFLRKP